MERSGHTFTMHVGAPKTGTSAVQHVLRSTPPRGLYYPQTGQWPDGSHHRIAFAWLGRTPPGAAAPERPGDLLGALRQEILTAPVCDTVLSTEEVFDTPRAGLKLLDALRDRLGARFQHWQIVATVRDHSARLASAYNQAVKDGYKGETRHPDTFARETLAEGLYAPRLSIWRGSDVPLHLVPYAPAETLVPRLLTAFGTTDVPDTAEPRNRSIGPRAIAALLISNTLLDDPARRTAFFADLRKSRPFPVWERPVWPFSSETDRMLARATAGDRRRLVDAFGLELAHEPRPDGPDFPGLDEAAREQVRAVCADLPGYDRHRDRIEAILGGERW